MTKPPIIPQKTERIAAGKERVINDAQSKEAVLKTGALQNSILNSTNFSSIATNEKGVIQIFNVEAERMLGDAAANMMNKIMPDLETLEVNALRQLLKSSKSTTTPQKWYAQACRQTMQQGLP